jgi:hypothetical protein
MNILHKTILSGAFAAAAVFALHVTALPGHAQNDGPASDAGSGASSSAGSPDANLRREMRKQRHEFLEVRRAERQFRQGEHGPGEEPPGRHEGPGERRGERIGRYLETVRNYQAAVQDPYQAVGLAVLGLKDAYRRGGNAAEAIKDMEEFLKTTKDQKMRNIFLFTIRQIYEEQHNLTKFAETNKQIIRENLTAIEK